MSTTVSEELNAPNEDIYSWKKYANIILTKYNLTDNIILLWWELDVK